MRYEAHLIPSQVVIRNPRRSRSPLSCSTLSRASGRIRDISHVRGSHSHRDDTIAFRARAPWAAGSEWRQGGRPA